MKPNWLRRYWRWVAIAIIVVAAGALISVFSSYWLCQRILKFFSDWSVALSAGAAVILAVAAFLTIRNANEREQRRRQEELAKERRDKDEHLLNEIIEWAIDVVKVGVPIESTGFAGKMDEETGRRLVLNSLGRLRNNFRAMTAISLYASRIGLAFGEKLQNSIATLDRDLRKQEDLIIKCQDIVLKRKISELENAWTELMNNW